MIEYLENHCKNTTASKQMKTLQKHNNITTKTYDTSQYNHHYSCILPQFLSTLPPVPVTTSQLVPPPSILYHTTHNTNQCSSVSSISCLWPLYPVTIPVISASCASVSLTSCSRYSRMFLSVVHPVSSSCQYYILSQYQSHNMFMFTVPRSCDVPVSNVSCSSYSLTSCSCSQQPVYILFHLRSVPPTEIHTRRLVLVSRISPEIKHPVICDVTSQHHNVIYL